MTVLDLEDPSDEQRYRLTAFTAHDIGALVHDEIAVADLPVYLKVDAVETANESRDELLDGLPAVHRVHRNVVVHGVFGEVAGEFLRVGRRPLLAEFREQFVG